MRQGKKKCSREESNHHQLLRTELFYPLNYGSEKQRSHLIMVRFLKGTTITAVPAQYTFWISRRVARCDLDLTSRRSLRSQKDLRCGSHRNGFPTPHLTLGRSSTIHFTTGAKAMITPHHGSIPPWNHHRRTKKQKVLVCTRTFL